MRPIPPMQQRQALKADLGLTDVQKADLLKARETAQRDRLRKSTDLKIASMDLKSLLRAEKVDDKALAAKLAEVQAAQGALLKIRVDSALALKRILTPEQKKKMAQMRGQRMGQRNMGGNKGMRKRMGGAMGRRQGQGRGRLGQPMGHDMHSRYPGDLNPDGTVGS